MGTTATTLPMTAVSSPASGTPGLMSSIFMEHRAQVSAQDAEKKRALHGEIYSAKAKTGFHRGAEVKTTSCANREHHSRAAAWSSAVPPMSSCWPLERQINLASPNRR